MSETLKFGNGEWATKKGSTLAYNSENGNFKPLPFTFDRSTSATRVNKEGLIEVVTNNEPRIDFLNDSKGALLLEPSRTNLITYSEAFDNPAWSTYNAAITANQGISPDGTLTADNLQVTTANGGVFESISGTGVYTFSVFVKYVDTQYIRLRSTGTYVHFDLLNGVAIDGSALNADSYKIEDYGNGWYRCSITGNNTNTIVQVFTSDTSTGTPTGTGNALVWGAQVEQGSYATSYIPTQGSVVTRVAESCSQTPPSGIIGQTEGTIYVESKDVADDGSTKMITLNDGGQTNEIRIDFRTLNKIQLVFTVGGSPQAVISTSNYNSLEFNKIAFKYKENDFALWVNGVKVGVDTNGSTNATNVFSVLEFKRGSGLFPFYGSTKNVKLYNTALTDAELAALTKI